MEARRLYFVLAWLALSSVALSQTDYVAETPNFVVRAADQNLVRQVARKAEEYRKSLAIEWLGHELPNWSEKCPIEVRLARLPGGETTFGFVGSPEQRGPVEWDMKIYGPPDRLLDAVLPHEITHTIFATHFGQPLPRWADEGACTTVEHESERQKIQKLLIDYLSARPSKGIPFNRLFPMMQYPDEMLPLYAQSYSLAHFLILQKGRQHFVKYVEAGLAASRPGLETAAWDQATRNFFGFENLSELQLSWVKWVKAGSPESLGEEFVVRLNDNHSVNTNPSQSDGVRVASNAATTGDGQGWYRRQMQQGTPVTDRTEFQDRGQRPEQSSLLIPDQQSNRFKIDLPGEWVPERVPEVKSTTIPSRGGTVWR